MTSPALWLVRRELAARGRRVALAGAVVAALAGAVMVTELVARAREAAVAAQVDAVGPALTLVPAGMTASGLARYQIDGVLPPGTEDAARRVLGPQLRAVERRLVFHREIAGARRPVVGVDPIVGSEPVAVAGSASVGAELGRSVPVGSRIRVGAQEFDVLRVLPSTASAEDLSVFLPIEDVRGLEGATAVNELRVFLAAGVSVRDAEARLARAIPGATVVRSDRGEVAERGIPEALARHRHVAYAVMGVVAALTLLIAAHLDATERRAELATLAALGASRGTILGGLLARSAVVAVAGAVLGTVAGAVIATMVAPAVPSTGATTWTFAAAIVGAAACIAVVAAAPTAFVSAARDPVRELQEG